MRDVADAVSNETDDEWANEQAWLSREGQDGQLDGMNASIPCL